MVTCHVSSSPLSGAPLGDIKGTQGSEERVQRLPGVSITDRGGYSHHVLALFFLDSVRECGP